MVLWIQFKSYIQEISKIQHGERQNTAPQVVQPVPTRFLHFEVNCYNVGQCATQHLQALLRSLELLAYCEQLEVRVGRQASRYHLPAPTKQKLLLLFKDNLDFILHKTVVTILTGAMSCQLPKSNQQINSVLLPWKAVTPLYQECSF